MCFTNDDCDWYPSIQEVTRQRSNKLLRCYECRRDIDIYDWYQHVFQQEHEECQCDVCELGENFGDPNEKCWGCYGETFECDICDNCRLIRKAIYQVELDEGCPPGARQPGYGGLEEVFVEHYDALKYVLRAVKMFPELEGNSIFHMERVHGE